LPLESGEAIRDFEISYVAHGTRARRRRQCHPRPDRDRLDPSPAGFSDRSRAAARSRSAYFIICADAIGNGLSTSPSNSQTQPDLSFPRFSIRDMVASQRKLLDALGVERIASIVGASMGGMQALQWASAIPIVCEAWSPLCRWRVPVPGQSR
jgi:homoserine O-acetyltransferase